MKMKLITILNMAGTLLAFAVSAQEGPVRILPAPAPQPDIAIEVEPAPPPPNFFPGQEFPEEPMEPEEGWGEPGFPGEMNMMMPSMPGRYKILTVQLPQAGKLASVVLKLDTQTGETWQLKLTESKFFFNGQQQVRTQLSFQPVTEAHPPRHGRLQGVGVDHNHDHGEVEDDIEIERSIPDRPNIIEARPTVVPVRPRLPRIRVPRREP